MEMDTHYRDTHGIFHIVHYNSIIIPHNSISFQIHSFHYFPEDSEKKKTCFEFYICIYVICCLICFVYYALVFQLFVFVCVFYYQIGFTFWICLELFWIVWNCVVVCLNFWVLFD